MIDLDRYFDPGTSAAAARPLEERWASGAVTGPMPQHGIGADRLDAVLAGIVDAAAADRLAPRRSRLERTLLACRVPEPTARLLAATTGLRVAWLAAVAVVLVFAAAADRDAEGVGRFTVFLAIAPVVPVLGVAATFSTALDRSRDVATAAAHGGLRLAVLRTVTVASTAFAVNLVAALLSPAAGWVRLAWVLPSIALAIVTLALAGRFGVQRSALAVLTTWFALVAVVGLVLDDGLAPYRAPGQLAAAAVIAVASALARAWRQRFEWNWSDR